MAVEDCVPETTECLLLNSTPAIQDFLARASSLAAAECVPSAVASEAARHVGAASVPYPLLRDLWRLLYPNSVARFHQLVAGSTISLESPAPRLKSQELVERLSKLQDLADRKEYEVLVSDIVVPEKEYFSSYRNQLGFGLHVIATMFTCFMVGYGIFRALFQSNAVIHVAGGLMGLIFGMFLETTLYIISVSERDKQPRKGN